MGSETSKLLDAEKTSWVLSHNLKYDDVLRREQLDLLPKFGKNLEVRFDERVCMGTSYNHWWVTDGRWVVELGGGEIRNKQVMIHRNNPPGLSVTENKFTFNDKVTERLKKVCGATNYSLRNCEHMARYISCGSASRWRGTASSRTSLSLT